MDDQLLDLPVALSPERLEHKYPFPRHPLSGNLLPSPLNSGKPGLTDCRKKIYSSCRGKFLTLSWLQLILSVNNSRIRIEECSDLVIIYVRSSQVSVG
ncbi:hypothetical protein NPIL_495221 [Nephila pilipes]|uniref:Uncharacterized protein n=1 Tax=Nephila pilipes TaxID=299642 RepID=A0A8X6JNU4_NEPPI|nr:hypothetical protein NPIL_495221 [Nephila pilipes]